MSWLALALASLFIPSSQGASDFRGYDTELWGKYFPALEVPVYRETDPSRLLTVDRAICGDEMARISGWMSEYATDAVHSNSTETQRLHQRIQTFLFQDLGESHLCFESAVRSYLLNAVRIGDAEFYVDHGEFQSSTGMRRVMLVAALLNGGYVSWLTPQRRLEYGEIWAEKAAETSSRAARYSAEAYQLLGAYDCQQSRIFVDPTLPPINFGSIVVHELDHLLRDKYVTPEDLRGFRRRGRYHWDSVILFDEIIASIVSTQKLQPLRQGGEHWETWLKLVDPLYRAAGPMTLLGDLDMNSRTGPLQRMIDTGGDLPLVSSLYFPLSHFHVGSYGLSVRKTKRSMIRLLNRAYFQGRSLRGHLKVLEGGEFTGKPLFKLTAWEDRYRPSWWSGSQEMSAEDRQLHFEIGEVTRALQGVDELMPKMRQSSYFCSEFQNAIRKGELKHFIGTPAGQGGVKPGQGGVKPGQGGVKPGQGGVKPGQGGVKPSTSGIHPCLSGVF